MQEQDLLEKIRSLPPERISEVEDFIDFLRERNSSHQPTLGESIASYAARNRGTDADFDPDLEAAAVEHLRGVE